MRRRAWLRRLSPAVAAGGAFLVVSGQPIGLSQMELQPPGWSGEHVVPYGFSRSIRPSAAVADLIEAIWDWDIPEGDAAAAFTIKVPVPVANSISRVPALEGQQGDGDASRPRRNWRKFSS